jgi:cytochrome c oxidase subunit IV
MSEHNTHHIVPKSIYYTIFLALMVGTGLTWWVATIDLGAMNNVIMLSIAVTKATLVVLFFMHMTEAPGANRLVFSVSIVFMLVMMTGVFGDLLTRNPMTLPNGAMPPPSELQAP